jgi:hypothetical protein
MTSAVIQSWIGVVILFLVFAGDSVLGQLPGLKKEPWVGYFAVYQQRDFIFKLDSKGEGIVVPLLKTGTPISRLLCLPVRIFIEEKLADGKTFERKVQMVSLITADIATDRLAKVTYKGKTVGEAAFEVTVEAHGAVLRYGGRITDKGSLTEHPIQLCVQVKFPRAYKVADLDKKLTIKQIREDVVKVTRADGKRCKLPSDKPLSEPPNEVAEKDLSAVGVKIGAWRGTEFEFTTTPHSAIRLSTVTGEDLHRGFFVQWSPDPVADLQGAARFLIEVK